MHPREEQLNDYVDGELVEADAAAVSAHLQRCTECALLAAQLQSIIRHVRALPPMTPPADSWERIRSQVAAAGFERSDSPPEPGQPRRSVRPVLWGLAAAAAIVLAFLGGRVIERQELWHQKAVDAQAGSHPASRPAPADVDGARDANSLSSVRERVLLVAVGDHLERSQIILVELANAHTHGQLDISEERQSADDLLASNRLYRQTAEQLGNANVAGVLGELERVLVEVARGPSRVSMRQLEEIQQRIESQGILFKVKIINATIAGAKAPVS